MSQRQPLTNPDGSPNLDADHPNPHDTEYECLACHTVYEEDLGVCPKDQNPLRKVGDVAIGGQAEQVAFSTEGRPNPPSPAFGSGMEPEVAPYDARLAGEKPSHDRPMGDIAG